MQSAAQEHEVLGGNESENQKQMWTSMGRKTIQEGKNRDKY